MAVARVNVVGNHSDAGVASLAAPSYSQGSGHSLVIGVRVNVSDTVTMSDTAGDTFVPSLNLSAADGTNVQTFYVKSTIANAANVVTATFTASRAFVAIIVHEYSGTDTTSTLDTTASNVLSANPITSGSFTPSASGNVAIAFGQDSQLSTVFSAGTNYTIQDQDSYLGSEDFIGTGASAQTAAMGFNGSAASTVIAVMVLNVSSGGGFTAKFRKTLSPMGTKVGSRQLHDYSH